MRVDDACLEGRCDSCLMEDVAGGGEPVRACQEPVPDDGRKTMRLWLGGGGDDGMYDDDDDDDGFFGGGDGYGGGGGDDDDGFWTRDGGEEDDDELA